MEIYAINEAHANGKLTVGAQCFLGHFWDDFPFSIMIYTRAITSSV